MEYPVKPELEAAIETLFQDSSVGLGFLGRGLGLAPMEESLSPGAPAPDRVKLLRAKLEKYVSDLAAEYLELGEDEGARLRAEATGMLVVLRELRRHFPEAF